jgi:hypothetical protein
MANQRRRKPIVLQPGQHPASLPLNHPPREIFAQAVARGVNVDVAYREAGYIGNSASRRELRCSADVDARIKWLLVQRIEADAQARARVIEKEHDARLRLIKHLEALAYSDTRDVVQWDRDPLIDEDGTLVGWRDRMEVTPSRLLTREQAAMVRSVTTKSGGIKFEVIDRLTALEKLAKVLGLPLDVTPQTVTNTQVNVAHMNVSGNETALEAVRRLAFAIQKAARVHPSLEGTATLERGMVPVEGSEGSR